MTVHMNLDWEKPYTRVVDLVKIYNFVVQTFLNLSHLRAQIFDLMFKSKIRISYLGVTSII
jgi:hypothetical protein